MTLPINEGIQIPYQIGCHIASLVPNVDKFHRWSTLWAAHAIHFQRGPNPSTHQLEKGLILEVSKLDHKPQALHTRYGHWIILGSSRGSFKKIFSLLEKTLNLKNIDEYSHPHLSLWEIKNWRGKELPNALRARRNAFIPPGKALFELKKFTECLFLINLHNAYLRGLRLHSLRCNSPSKPKTTVKSRTPLKPPFVRPRPVFIPDEPGPIAIIALDCQETVSPSYEATSFKPSSCLENEDSLFLTEAEKISQPGVSFAFEGLGWRPLFDSPQFFDLRKNKPF